MTSWDIEVVARQGQSSAWTSLHNPATTKSRGPNAGEYMYLLGLRAT